jgi:hypothetical protein
MTVRRVVKLLPLAGVIATWAGAGSIVLGVFATVCGTALGAVHSNLSLATSIGARGFVAGLIAGAIVGVCVAIDRIETESYLAKVAVRLPPTTDWTTTVATKARYPEWRMVRVKNLRGP